MPSLSLDGVIAPDGWVPLMVIEADNPGGDVTPFGTLTWEANFSLDAPNLGGVITPEGDLTTGDDSQCFPALYACVADPVPNTVETDVCEPVEIPAPPSRDLEGTIIPIGTLEELVFSVYTGGIAPSGSLTTDVIDACDFGNLIAGDLNALSDITDQGWTFNGPGPSVDGVTSIVMDAGEKAILMDITVHGSLTGNGLYYLSKDFSGLNPSAFHYAEMLMRKEEVLSFLSETGLNIEGNGNFTNVVGSGLSGYEVIQTQVVLGFPDGTQFVSFGSFGVQNGDQNHHERYYFRYIKLIEVGCG